MQENTESNTTSFEGTPDQLDEALQKAYSEGSVIPVLMEGVMVGTATVLAGGKVSVTLNDESSARLNVQHGDFSMSFDNSPKEMEEGYYPEALCSKCDLPAGHIKACE